MDTLNLHTISGSKVLSGREEGEMMRKKLKLDTRDFDEKKYSILVPEVFAVTASYFLACFGKSVRSLGKEKFEKKYIFKCNNNVSIENNIKDGIDSVIKLELPF